MSLEVNQFRLAAQGRRGGAGPHARRVRGPKRPASAPVAGASACPATSGLKRGLDFAVAAAALLVLAPLLLLIALVVRLETPGPALFSQRRGGLGGKPFVIYKFRTMDVREDGDTIRHATRLDPRVTGFGAFLRKTSIDELPQLINVLKGDMSLVGPRPHALAHDEYYGEKIPAYAERLTVKPGLTGLAQVSGLRGEILGLDCMARRVAADLDYIRSWSVMLDLKLLVLTLTRAPFDERAY